MRPILYFVVFFTTKAIKIGCDPETLFLHEKIPSTERKYFKQPLWKNGVKLDRKGTSAKWTRSCCLRRDPQDDTKCLEKAKDLPMTRRVVCRFLFK